GRCMRTPAQGRRCSTECPDYLHASRPGLAQARSGVVNVDSACRTCAVRLSSQAQATAVYAPPDACICLHACAACRIALIMRCVLWASGQPDLSCGPVPPAGLQP
ncbi:hypothetical protein DB828_15255, partial [Xanthomonas perforans]